MCHDDEVSAIIQAYNLSSLAVLKLKHSVIKIQYWVQIIIIFLNYKHYQLYPKQKLMQTNSLVISMTFMFLSA